MPGLVWKTINGKKHLVMRWKKRVNGKLKIIKEIYIGNMENLADMLENPMKNVDVKSFGFGISAMSLMVDEYIGLRKIIDEVVGHKGKGMSPGDYTLLFAMNRLSDPRSKNGIGEWMVGDFASTIFPIVTSQEYWNMMDRFNDEQMKEIKTRIRDKLISLGYDHSHLFIDGSNFYTFMEENDMAKKGHNKAHRYDLNQISYYIEANEDYIPFFFDSYPGNEPDVNTFPMIIENIPKESTIIFDRGYNSEKNIGLLNGMEYIGALIESDHKDLMYMDIKKDSFIETTKIVYGKEHRIIVYYSSKLERKQIRSFMKMFKKAYTRVKKIINSGNSDSISKAQYCLESVHLQETILLPNLKINIKHMEERFRMFGKGAIFTNIYDMKPENVLELYRKRNRIEHCFRTISINGLAKPEYHWTPQKIKVNMFFSYISYLFLAIMRMKIMPVKEMYLTAVKKTLETISIIYMVRGKTIEKRLFSGDETAKEVIEKLDLIKMA